MQQDRERAALVEEMNGLTWVHSIDLGGGLVTPGKWGPHNPKLVEAVRGLDFRGMRVLDIGCWDGLFSFEAEKLGAAEVYATDLVSQRPYGQPTFAFAKRVLKSEVKYFPNISVFDVESLGIRDFDLVLFMGIYYHLRDPLRAFTALRRVLREGGHILVEGAVLDQPGCHADFYYKHAYFGDYSNWFVPTVECLRQWIESTYFDIEHEYGHWGTGTDKRMTVRARAVRRADQRYLYPDPDLDEFHQG
jgi:tRNA (mo5U34)-methyltransferase